MPRARPIPLGLTFLTFLCCTLVYSAEPAWLEIHSTHFTVITDAGEKKGREVALRFEQMRAVFALTLTKDRLNQPVPITILAYQNDRSYYQAAPLRQGQPIDVPGFLLLGNDQHFVVLNLSESEPWRETAHDFARMLLTYNYPPAQAWFDNGLTDYFSSIRVDDRQVRIGGNPEFHLEATQASQNAQPESHPTKLFTELLSSENWLPLPTLFATKDDQSQLYRAESWIVMHYLLHERKLPETGAYFGLVLNERVTVDDAIQRAFGMTSAEFEKAVKDYFHSQASTIASLDADPQKNPAAMPGTAPLDPAYRFPVPVGPEDSTITAKPLPEADARALYAQVQIRVPERRESGLQELKTLATTPTEFDKKSEAKAEKAAKKPTDDDAQLPTNAIGNALAHRILAWDHIEHNEFERAITELGDAAALNQRDMWVRYYLCVMKYRMAQASHTDIQGLANMMLDLKAVLDWYPELAGAYDLLALARKEGGSTPAAMQAERAAMTLSPRDERYVFHLAQIYVDGKKWDAAAALLEKLKDSSDPQIATGARDRLSQMQTERKYGISSSSVQTQSTFAPQKSPFDVLEQEAAKRSAAEKAPPTAGPQDKRPTKYIKGRLLAIDCSQSPIAILTVSVGGSVLKLRAGDYKNLVLIGADDFTCEWRDRQVTVNYKPGGITDGDLVSLELR